MAGLVACGRQDPLPDDLAEPLVWLLVHVDDAEADVAARVDRLAEYAAGFDDAAAADRRFRPGAPTDDHVRALRSDGADVGDGALISTGIVAASDEDLDDHLRLQGVLDRACLEGDFATWTRTFTNGACLPDDACDDALVEEAWTADDAAGTATASLRVVPRDDGRRGLIVRTLPTSGGGPLGVDVWVDDDDATRRVSARWRDGATAAWPDATADALQGAAERAEAWLDGDVGCAPSEDE